MKPLNMKNYGSIPHLPNSRLGPADHMCHPGQAHIATVKTRDKQDIVIVQEKLDGSNVGVARIGDLIYPITRAGWLATSSPYEQHHIFYHWAMMNKARFLELLQDGERLVGEWLYQAHGTRYRLPHEPFVAFDIMRGSTRTLHHELTDRLADRFRTPHLIHYDRRALSVDDALAALGDFGHHGALDYVEGAVWRVERGGKVDFLTKFVRKDKLDGIYLPELTDHPPYTNEFIDGVLCSTR